MRKIDLSRRNSNFEEANFLHLSSLDSLYFSSKISGPEDVEYFKALGIKHVIDLKHSNETDLDEESLWKNAGIDYKHFPVSDVTTLTQEQIEAFQVLLEGTQEPTLVYCMSSNRVAAIMGLYLSKICGHPKERVIDLLSHMGMTKEELRNKIVQKIKGA